MNGDVARKPRARALRRRSRYPSLLRFVRRSRWRCSVPLFGPLKKMKAVFAAVALLAVVVAVSAQAPTAGPTSASLWPFSPPTVANAILLCIVVFPFGYFAHGARRHEPAIFGTFLASLIFFPPFRLFASRQLRSLNLVSPPTLSLSLIVCSLNRV